MPRSAAVTIAALCLALTAGVAGADEALVQTCKKKATTDYRGALRHCQLVERGFRPFEANCRANAKSRYDRALRNCIPAVARKAGEDPLPPIIVDTPPPKDPTPEPKPPPPKPQ